MILTWLFGKWLVALTAIPGVVSIHTQDKCFCFDTKLRKNLFQNPGLLQLCGLGIHIDTTYWINLNEIGAGINLSSE